MIQTHVPQQTASKSGDKEEDQSGGQTNGDWVKHSPPGWLGNFPSLFQPTKVLLHVKACSSPGLHATRLPKTKPTSLFASCENNPAHFCSKLQKASIALKHLGYRNHTVPQQSNMSYFNFSSLTIGLGCRDITDFTFFFFPKASLIVLFLITLQSNCNLSYYF